MRRLVVPLLFAVGSVLACTPETPTRPDAPPRSGLGLPSDPPIAAPRALLPAMPADCGTAPELAAVGMRPTTSTLPIATAVERARQIPARAHPAGDVARWFAKEPTDSRLVKLRDGRMVWMVGYAEPPPFAMFGRGRGSRWTAWIALLDATSGDYVLALTCGRVEIGGSARL